MASLNITLLKSKRLVTGKHRVRIALTHKGKTRYFVTRFEVTEREFAGGRIVRRADAAMLNVQLGTLLQDYQTKLDNIDYKDMRTVDELKRIMELGEAEDNETLADALDKVKEESKEDGRRAVWGQASSAARLVREFGDTRLKELSPVYMEAFAKFLAGKGYSADYQKILIVRIKVTLHERMRIGLLSYKVDPFVLIKPIRCKVRDNALSLETMRKVLALEPRTAVQRRGFDLFRLSFMLGGMNLADIVRADFSGERVEYIRQKTAKTAGTFVSLLIPEEAKPIIRYWIGADGRLDLQRGMKRKSEVYRNYCQHFRLMCEANGFEGVVFYSARKSFAQYACDLEIPDAYVDYCLGHSPSVRGVISSYSRVRREKGDMVVRRVLDYVFHGTGGVE